MSSLMLSLMLKRVYEQPDAGDGTRILVDRLWPRGIARDRARIDLWLKDICAERCAALAERLGPDATIVTVMCDTGMKYLSRS